MYAYVAEGEAYDRRFVQLGLDGGMEGEETAQISKHIRLHAAPPSGRLTADSSAKARGRVTAFITRNNVHTGVTTILVM